MNFEPPELRAEEIIAEIYRQISEIRAAERKPRRVVIPKAVWEKIQEYRRNLGELSGPYPDYIGTDHLFGVEIWYDNQSKIRVE